MTILPAKRQNAGKSEEPEDSSQSSQLNISPSRLNHHGPMQIGLNIAQGHGQLLIHQESKDIWRHDDLSHSRPSHSSHGNFEDGPSSSKRNRTSYAYNSKERYLRNQERKRQKQDRERVARERERDRDRDMEQQMDGSLERSPQPVSSVPGNEISTASANEDAKGYNSEDEYSEHRSQTLTNEEWRQRDVIFSRALERKGFVIKPMVEDGACLFRAIADQVYGDQNMHRIVRKHCMDYIVQNRDFYCAYVTEDFNKYVSRKRHDFVHGNHLEIQALSEMYHRTIEVYCYQLKPINIFHGAIKTDYEPIRLSYHRSSHYNSITNPFKPTVGMGLGLPSFMLPADQDRRQLSDAVRQSEDQLLEQAMLEDKLKATDWEATNEAIEEQVARESYLQWCKDNEKRKKQQQSQCVAMPSSSCTVTSAAGGASPKSPRSRGSASPHVSTPVGSPRSSPRSGTRSPSLKHSFPELVVDENAGAGDITNTSDAAAQWTSATEGAACSSRSVAATFNDDNIFSRLPPEVFGLPDWEDAGVMARILAQSQQEYLDSLKAAHSHCSPGPSTSR